MSKDKKKEAPQFFDGCGSCLIVAGVIFAVLWFLIANLMEGVAPGSTSPWFPFLPVLVGGGVAFLIFLLNIPHVTKD